MKTKIKMFTIQKNYKSKLSNDSEYLNFIQSINDPYNFFSLNEKNKIPQYQIKKILKKNL